MTAFTTGSRHSDETKRQISEAHKGKRLAHHSKTVASRRRNAGDPGHGTATRYKGTTARPPCRCDECRTAWREYKRERQAARAS